MIRLSTRRGGRIVTGSDQPGKPVKGIRLLILRILNGLDLVVYTLVGLASFRESSELEYGADGAFLLVRGDPAAATLRHVKSRHGEPLDVPLRFDGACQRFEADGSGRLTAAVRGVAGRQAGGADGGDW